MKKAFKVLSLVLLAALSVNAGHDVQRYYKAHRAAQFVAKKVKESPQVKEVEVKECVHVSDMWICYTAAISVDGDEVEAFLPVPDDKIR